MLSSVHLLVLVQLSWILVKLLCTKLFTNNFQSTMRYSIVPLTFVGGDIDSLFLEVTGVDLIGTLYPKMVEDGLLDTSNYDKHHKLYSEKYKAQFGCIKDEFAWCGLQGVCTLATEI